MVDKPNLWIFGDSYSYKWELPDKGKESRQHDYTKYFFEKYGEFPTHFSDILNDEYNFGDVNNLAIRGADNYSILESIGRCINNIRPSDYVVIGWSEVTRYRLVWETKKGLRWYCLYPNSEETDWKDVNRDHLSHVINRDSKLTYKEIQNWQNILLKSLPFNVIFWTPFWMKNNDIPFLSVNQLRETGKLVLIEDKTNGDIPDRHFSEDAMKNIGEWMIDHFKNNKFRKTNIL